MPGRTHLIVTLAVGIGCVSLIFAGAKGGDNPHQSTPADSLHAERMIPEEPRERGTVSVGPRTITGSGIVEPLGRVVEVSAPEVGIIAKILVAEGETVSAGAPLIQLDDETQRAAVGEATASLRLAALRAERLSNGARMEELARAKAAVTAAQAQAVFAQKNLDRFTTAGKTSAISAEAFDRAALELQVNSAKVKELEATLSELEAGARADDLAVATQEVQLAQTRLEAAQTALNRRQIRAPQSGKILKIKAKPGELHSPEKDAWLLQLADLSQLTVRLEVDERDIAQVTIGSTAELTDYALSSDRASAIVTQILGQATTKRSQLDRPGERFDVRVVEVVCRLEPGTQLLPGMRVLGLIEGKAKP